MRIVLVAGARPNFIKIAPICRELQRAGDLGESVEFFLVHTGQHYDEKMSQSFFDQLKIPRPDVNLEVGAGSQTYQIATIMIRFEEYLQTCDPDLVLVVGDVNSTLACAIVAKKLGIRLGHVEAGLRSYDKSMPEEINRLAVDAIADVYFTTTRNAATYLEAQGISKRTYILLEMS